MKNKVKSTYKVIISLFLTILMGGQSLYGAFSFKVPFTTITHGLYWYHWGAQGTFAEQFLPFVPHVVTDICIMNNSPHLLLSTSLSAAINAGLKSRALILDNYQKNLYGTDQVVNEELKADLLRALQIFCGYSHEEAYKIPVISLNNASWLEYGTVRNSSLGIFATNKAIFVDVEFLQKWRLNDPIVYTFLIAYGVSQLEKKTFFKRQIVSIADLASRSFCSGMLAPYAQAIINAGALKIGFRSLGDLAGDVNRGWCASIGLFFIRIARDIASAVIIDALYQACTSGLKQHLYQKTETLKPTILGMKFTQFYEETFKKLLNRDFFSRVNHIQQELVTIKTEDNTEASQVRMWLVDYVIGKLEICKKRVKKILAKKEAAKKIRQMRSIE